MKDICQNFMLPWGKRHKAVNHPDTAEQGQEEGWPKPGGALLTQLS